ncbi:MAG: small, acid-soluble spore protein, alpha/beta type [Clostridia bacterium]|nr:small, acid-soluble spore protein, alpha/beta type [Clostridia bacterium]
MANKQAKEALNSLKPEAASEVGVNPGAKEPSLNRFWLSLFP